MDGRPSITRRRGIYLLPNLLTTCGLFAGFYSIVASIDGNFERAALAIFAATAYNWRAKRQTRKRKSSCRPACTSWPRRRRSCRPIKP